MAGTADALRQAALVQTESQFIARGRGKIRQSIVQLEDECCCRQSTERDSRIAAFHPPERIAADKETSRHIARGDAALASGKREIAAQLAERVGGRQRNGTRF